MVWLFIMKMGLCKHPVSWMRCKTESEESKMMHYILQGKNAIEEPDLIVWAQWFQSANRTVKKTQVSAGVEVSTVFLGLDHSFGNGEPILFETMIFGGERDGFCERCTTYENAENGHALIVSEFSQRCEF